MVNIFIALKSDYCEALEPSFNERQTNAWKINQKQQEMPLPPPPKWDCKVLLIFQAVWAGWGHASENPKLPDLLSKHGITFIGKYTFLCLYIWKQSCISKCVLSCPGVNWLCTNRIVDKSQQLAKFRRLLSLLQKPIQRWCLSGLNLGSIKI